MIDRRQWALSLIVPVYNVGGYVEACLESIRRQECFRRLQVILVDDGSTDGGSAIVDAFAAAHENVDLLRQENSGLGAARNAGLELASADLIGFLDGDDVLTPGGLDRLLGFMEANPGIDLAVGNVETIPRKSTFVWQSAFEPGDRIVESVLECPELIHSAAVWNKVYRRHLLPGRGPVFPPRASFEDAGVTVPIMLTVGRIGLVAETVVHYRKRVGGGSVMDSVFSRRSNFNDYLDVLDRVMDAGARLAPELRTLAQAFCVRGFQGFLLRAQECLEGDELVAFLRRAAERFAECPASVIAENVIDQRHRRAYALLAAMHHVGEYPLSPTRDLRVRVRGSRPRFAESGLGADAPLFAGTAFIASMESCSPVEGGLMIEGRVVARPFPLDREPNIALSLHMGGNAYPATWTRRTDRSANDGEWSAFSVHLPLAGMSIGEHHLRLGLATGASAVEIPLLATAAMFKTSRPLQFGDRTTSWSAGPAREVVLRCGLVPQTSLGAHREHAKRLRNLIAASGEQTTWAAVALLRRATGRTGLVLLSDDGNNASNVRAFYRSLVAERSTRSRVRLLVDGPGQRRGFLRRDFRAVRRGSMRHKLVLACSEVVVAGWPLDPGVSPPAWSMREFLEGFLVHTQIKRVLLRDQTDVGGKDAQLHRLAQGFDLVLCADKDEQGVFAERFGYAHRAILTGFPRWDELGRAATEISRRKGIVFAPAWATEPNGVIANGIEPGPRLMPDPRDECQTTEILRHAALRSYIKEASTELVVVARKEAWPAMERILETLAGSSLPLRRIELEAMALAEWLPESAVLISDGSTLIHDARRAGVPVATYPRPVAGHEPLSGAQCVEQVLSALRAGMIEGEHPTPARGLQGGGGGRSTTEAARAAIESLLRRPLGRR